MSAATMCAAVFTGQRSMRIERLNRPMPGPGEVLIRLEGCGVCASNLATWVGMPWTQFPSEPGGLGHEGRGVIDGVGDGAKGLAQAARVASLAYHAFAEYDLAPANVVARLPA